MSITIELDVERLVDPHVAAALRTLVATLGPSHPGGAERSPVGADAFERYAAYLDTLSGTSRRFLELLEQRRELTVAEAGEALGLRRYQTLGGITGAIVRWAPTRGVPVPFEKVDLGGEPGWRWLGLG